MSQFLNYSMGYKVDQGTRTWNLNPCEHCGEPEDDHVGRKCLFQPTHFEAPDPRKVEEQLKHERETVGQALKAFKELFGQPSIARSVFKTVEPLKKKKR